MVFLNHKMIAPVTVMVITKQHLSMLCVRITEVRLVLIRIPLLLFKLLHVPQTFHMQMPNMSKSVPTVMMSTMRLLISALAFEPSEHPVNDPTAPYSSRARGETTPKPKAEPRILFPLQTEYARMANRPWVPIYGNREIKLNTSLSTLQVPPSLKEFRYMACGYHN